MVDADLHLMISVTPTSYVTADDIEKGFVIGLLRLPFSLTDEVEIRGHAIDLASRLCEEFGQRSCSVEFPDKTILVEVQHATS